MNILNSVFWGCLGGLAVVLPYIIYMRIRTRRKPSTAIGKPIGDRTAPVMPDKKRIFRRMILRLTCMPN